MKPKITLNIIAKQANLSIASVSRVLRNPQNTSWSTQTRVHQAIKDLNIDINQIKKNYIRMVVTNKILIIDNQLLSNNLINQGIEKELTVYNYQIFYLGFCHCNNNDISQIIHYTLQHLFDGILIINDAPYLPKLLQYSYTLPPIVLVNHFSLHYPCVYFDHLMIAYHTTTYLLNSGYKRIAIILGKDNKPSSKYLIQGYQQALLRANTELNPNYIVSNCFSYEHGKQAIKTLLQHNRPPAAVIFTDHICLNCMTEKELVNEHFLSPYHSVLGALYQCHQMHIAIPKQLSLLYFSHDLQKQYNELDTVSCVNKPLQIMGKKSVQLLLQLLEKNNPSIQISNPIDTETILRSST